MQYYVDGACSQNGTWQGGWGVIILEKETVVRAFGNCAENTTNNIMELQGFIAALKEMNQFEKNEIYSDSAYICNCIGQKWYVKWKQNGWLTSKKEPVLNKELWEELISLYELKKPKVIKVKGHSSNKYNNLADKVAVYCKEQQKPYNKTGDEVYG